MAYASASDIGHLCPNLLQGELNFSEATVPTVDAVEYWLSSGCSRIHMTLSANGYSTPVSQASDAYDFVSQLNMLYAAAWAEMSRVNVTLSTRERTRGQVFMEMFEKGLEQLADGDLSQAGLTVSGTAPLYIAGISRSDRDSVEDDSDRIATRFKRDMMRFPGTISSGDADVDEQRRPT